MKRIARTAAPVIVALALVLGGSSAALASSKKPVAPYAPAPVSAPATQPNQS